MLTDKEVKAIEAAGYWQEAVPVIRDVVQEMESTVDYADASTARLLRGWVDRLNTVCP